MMASLKIIKFTYVYLFMCKRFCAVLVKNKSAFESNLL